MFKAAVGHSEDVDELDAAAEVLEQCAEQLGGAAPSAGILFASSDYDAQKVLQAIAEKHPGLPLVGTSSVAEISSRLPHAEGSLVLMLFASDRIELAAGYGEGAPEDPERAAAEAVSRAKAGLTQPPRLAICFTDGARTNVSAVEQALRAALGPEVALVGGASSCDFTVELRPRELFGTRVLDGGVAVLLFAGPLRFAHGLEDGWQPVGKRHVLTRAEGNLVLEIDGRPALDLYKEYLGTPGNYGMMFVHHPLAVFENEKDFFLRAGFAPGPVPGSIMVAGGVPQGATVQLSEFARDRVLEAAERAVTSTLQRWGEGAPAAALLITCSTRKTVLGTWTGREVDAVRSRLPPGAPLAGFYAFGELAPPPGSRACRVHNCSIVPLLLGEA